MAQAMGGPSVLGVCHGDLASDDWADEDGVRATEASFPLVGTTSYSFPSGHAVAGAAIAIALVMLLVPVGQRRRNLEMIAAAFAVIMGLSRVYLRAHWLSDAVAGVAMGAGVVIGVAAVMHFVAGRGYRDV